MALLDELSGTKSKAHYVGRTFLSDAFDFSLAFMGRTNSTSKSKGIGQSLPCFAEAPSKAEEEVEGACPEQSRRECPATPAPTHTSTTETRSRLEIAATPLSQKNRKNEATCRNYPANTGFTQISASKQVSGALRIPLFQDE